MQKPLFISSLALTLCFAWVPALLMAEPTEKQAASEVDTDKLGYFFGYYFGNLLKEQGSVDINLNEVRRGIMDSVAGKASSLNPEEQKMLMAVIGERKTALQDKKLLAGRDAAQVYLAENAKRKGINTTASGLQYEIITSGTGKKPIASDEVVVHYRGELLSGREFDSSYQRDKPAEFRLNQVIAGWTEGLQLMNKGAKYKFYIPPELGYGAGGVPKAGIPPNAVLIFDVELIDIK